MKSQKANQKKKRRVLQGVSPLEAPPLRRLHPVVGSQKDEGKKEAAEAVIDMSDTSLRPHATLLAIPYVTSPSTDPKRLCSRALVLGLILSQVLLPSDALAKKPKRSHAKTPAPQVELRQSTDADFQVLLNQLMRSSALSSSSPGASSEVDLLNSFLVRLRRDDLELKSAERERLRNLQRASDQLRHLRANFITENTPQGPVIFTDEFEFFSESSGDYGEKVRLQPTGLSAFFNRHLPGGSSGERARAEEARKIFASAIRSYKQSTGQIKYLEGNVERGKSKVLSVFQSVQSERDQANLIKEIIEKNPDLELPVQLKEKYSSSALEGKDARARRAGRTSQASSAYLCERDPRGAPMSSSFVSQSIRDVVQLSGAAAHGGGSRTPFIDRVEDEDDDRGTEFSDSSSEDEDQDDARVISLGSPRRDAYLRHTKGTPQREEPLTAQYVFARISKHLREACNRERTHLAKLECENREMRVLIAESFKENRSSSSSTQHARLTSREVSESDVGDSSPVTRRVKEVSREDASSRTLSPRRESDDASSLSSMSQRTMVSSVSAGGVSARAPLSAYSRGHSSRMVQKKAIFFRDEESETRGVAEAIEGAPPSGFKLEFPGKLSSMMGRQSYVIQWPDGTRSEASSVADAVKILRAKVNARNSGWPDDFKIDLDQYAVYQVGDSFRTGSQKEVLEYFQKKYDSEQAYFESNSKIQDFLLADDYAAARKELTALKKKVDPAILNEPKMKERIDPIEALIRVQLHELDSARSDRSSSSQRLSGRISDAGSEDGSLADDSLSDARSVGSEASWGGSPREDEPLLGRSKKAKIAREDSPPPKSPSRFRFNLFGGNSGYSPLIDVDGDADDQSAGPPKKVSVPAAGSKAGSVPVDVSQLRIRIPDSPDERGKGVIRGASAVALSHVPHGGDEDEDHDSSASTPLLSHARTESSAGSSPKSAGNVLPPVAPQHARRADVSSGPVLSQEAQRFYDLAKKKQDEVFSSPGISGIQAQAQAYARVLEAFPTLSREELQALIQMNQAIFSKVNSEQQKKIQLSFSGVKLHQSMRKHGLNSDEQRNLESQLQPLLKKPRELSESLILYLKIVNAQGRLAAARRIPDAKVAENRSRLDQAKAKIRSALKDLNHPTFSTQIKAVQESVGSLLPHD